MTKIPTEHMEQATLLAWFDRTYIGLKGRLFSIPNGAQLAGNINQRAKQVNKLKAEGMQTGVPDLFLPVPANGYHGLFIEMKRLKRSTTSADQKKWHAYLNGSGYLCVVCKGHQSAISVISDYMKNTVWITQ